MTRMWMVDPKLMCREHLLGEHKELHQLVGIIKKGYSIQGYLDNQLIEVHNVKKRHKELVKEMKRRGYNHNSPLKFSCREKIGYVNREDNLAELRRRCKDCRRLKDNYKISPLGGFIFIDGLRK